LNATLLVSVLFGSLVGSAHCAAMCGGFVAAYAGTEGSGGRAAAHAAYHGGRLVTYATLGAAAGAFGRALDLAGRAAGLADAAGIVAGVLLLVTGAAGLAPRSRLVKLRARPAWSPTLRLGALLARFRAGTATTRALVLGLTTTLLPCGWLYAFVALAAASGSAVEGALVMGTFWVGTLPMLLGVGMSLGLVTRRWGGRLPQLRAGLVLAVGFVTLLTRLQLPAFAAGAQMATALGHHGLVMPNAVCHGRSHAGPAAPATRSSEPRLATGAP